GARRLRPGASGCCTGAGTSARDTAGTEPRILACGPARGPWRGRAAAAPDRHGAAVQPASSRGPYTVRSVTSPQNGSDATVAATSRAVPGLLDLAAGGGPGTGKPHFQPGRGPRPRGSGRERAL